MGANCVAGTSNSACGTGGATCKSCMGKSCVSQACQ
jgi:hypothetical protein